MAVELRSRTIANGTGGITLTLPAGWQANDIFLIICETNTGEAVTTPSGFTELTSSPQIASTTRLTVFWKRATASESNVTITDPGDHIMATLVAFSGAITTGLPFDVIAGDNTGATTSTAVAFPTVTPTIKDTTCVHISATGVDTTAAQLSSFSAPELSFPIGNANNTSSGGGGGFVIVHGYATAGVPINTTAILATTSQQARISLTIIPEAAADGDMQVPRSNLGTVALTLEQNAMSVARANLGAVALTLGQDNMSVARANIGFVVDIAPPTGVRRRGFFTFDP